MRKARCSCGKELPEPGTNYIAYYAVRGPKGGVTERVRPLCYTCQYSMPHKGNKDPVRIDIVETPVRT